jgi:Skp family chaperone for outer membrane proteins
MLTGINTMNSFSRILTFIIGCTLLFSVQAQDDSSAAVLRNHSEPVRQYLNACDRLAWQELPFAQPLVLPLLPDVDKNRQTELQQYLAMRLIQGRFYEEAGKVLNECSGQEGSGSAAFWIMKAVTAYQLGSSEKTAAALEQFHSVLQRSDTAAAVPRRYTEIAKLLQNETQQKQNEGEQIAKQMNNVRRKLGKGKTGDDTQKSEKDILQSLDKLIEKIEKQSQQANGEMQGRQGNNPAQDSFRLGQKAPGNVDRRDFSSDADWGSLPPKERDDALLKIEKDFPPFYRDIIEQYFRELAR